MGKRTLAATAVLAGLLCLLGSSAPALAQGNTWAGVGLAQMLDTALWRLGLLRVNAALTLAEAGYDSDIYFGYFDEPVPDWTLSASLPVQILFPLGKKVVLDLSDTPQYRFYLDTEKERAWNNTFRGQAHFNLDRVYLRAGGGLADVRRRFSPELDVNVREKRDGVDGLALWQASEAAAFALTYGWAKYDYGDADYFGTTISEVLNRKEQHLSLVTYVQPSPRTRFSLNGQFGTYTFTGETSSIRNARSYGILAGVDFIPRVGEIAGSTGLRGGISLGYTRFDFIDPGLVDGSGLTGEADITIDLTRRTSATVSFSRGFNFSVFAGATYYLSTSYGAGLSQRLSRKATMSYGLSFGRSAYPEGGIIQGLRNRMTTHAFSLNLRLARYLSGGVAATLSRRVRAADELPRNRNFFGLSLTYGSLGSGMSSPVGGMIR